ncbi:hypothetical protein LSAT2_008291, partial [Lamellibrachia satsuma]
FQIMFLIVTALLARSYSAAKVPAVHRCRMCKSVCSQNFMKCMKSCSRPEAARRCRNKLDKCRAKCEKKFGRDDRTK